MNRFKLLTIASCFILPGHISLAQQADYTREQQVRMAAGQPMAQRPENLNPPQTTAYAQPVAGYGTGPQQGYGQPGNTYNNQYPDRGYSNNPYGNSQGSYGQYQPGYQTSYGPGGGYDRRSDIFRIERLDRIVDLNGRQKSALFSLEQYYDRQFSVAPPSPGAYKQLMWQKSQDVLAVLTPFQRDRLFAFEQYKAYGGNAYGNNYGRNNGWGNQPGGYRPGGGQRW